MREVKEETNLDFIFKGVIDSYPFQIDDVHYIFIVLYGQADIDELRAGSDVQEVMLLSPNDAYTRITGKHAKQALKRWMIR